MDVQANYDDGHLVVAAVRVLKHRASGRPPTVEEIAELLRQSREWTGVLVSALERAGVVRVLSGPFETRVEVRDHRALESLPREDTTAGVDEELREFSAQKKKEEEALRNLFASGKALEKQRKKLEELGKDLKSYKPRPPKGPSLFRDSPPDES